MKTLPILVAAGLALTAAACGPAPSKDAETRADSPAVSDTAATPTPPDGTPVGGDAGTMPDAGTAGTGTPASGQTPPPPADQPAPSTAPSTTPPPQ